MIIYKNLFSNEKYSNKINRKFLNKINRKFNFLCFKNCKKWFLEKKVYSDQQIKNGKKEKLFMMIFDVNSSIVKCLVEVFQKVVPTFEKAQLDSLDSSVFWSKGLENKEHP